jgi:hypothetical protein
MCSTFGDVACEKEEERNLAFVQKAKKEDKIEVREETIRGSVPRLDYQRV